MVEEYYCPLESKCARTQLLFPKVSQPVYSKDTFNQIVSMIIYDLLFPDLSHGKSEAFSLNFLVHSDTCWPTTLDFTGLSGSPSVIGFGRRFSGESTTTLSWRLLNSSEQADSFCGISLQVSFLRKTIRTVKYLIPVFFCGPSSTAFRASSLNCPLAFERGCSGSG